MDWLEHPLGSRVYRNPSQKDCQVAGLSPNHDPELSNFEEKLGEIDWASHVDNPIMAIHAYLDSSLVP